MYNVKSSDPLQRMGKAEVSDSNEKKQTLSEVISQEPETRAVSSIEQDLWKQLKRIQIPVFSSDMKIVRQLRTNMNYHSLGNAYQEKLLTP